MVVADRPALKAWAEGKGIDASDMEALVKHPEVQALYKQEIAERAKGVKGFERPERFLLIPESFTTDNGMLTPSLKVKRRVVWQKFGPKIEALYAETPKKSKAAPAAEAS